MRYHLHQLSLDQADYPIVSDLIWFILFESVEPDIFKKSERRQDVASRHSPNAIINVSILVMPNIAKFRVRRSYS